MSVIWIYGLIGISTQHYLTLSLSGILLYSSQALVSVKSDAKRFSLDRCYGSNISLSPFQEDHCRTSYELLLWSEFTCHPVRWFTLIYCLTLCAVHVLSSFKPDYFLLISWICRRKSWIRVPDIVTLYSHFLFNNPWEASSRTRQHQYQKMSRSALGGGSLINPLKLRS